MNRKQFHAQAAEGHLKIAKSHKRMAALTKAAMDGCDDLAAEHLEQAGVHADLAENHLAMCKAAAADLDKRAGDDTLDGIRGVVTTFGGVTAVPRNGAPGLVDASRVDPRFQELVKVDDSLD